MRYIIKEYVVDIKVVEAESREDALYRARWEIRADDREELYVTCVLAKDQD